MDRVAFQQFVTRPRVAPQILDHDSGAPFRGIFAEIQFADDIVDFRIVVPGGGERRPLAACTHIDRHTAIVELHQRFRTPGADHRQVAKLFHKHFLQVIILQAGHGEISMPCRLPYCAKQNAGLSLRSLQCFSHSRTRSEAYFCPQVSFPSEKTIPSMDWII